MKRSRIVFTDRDTNLLIYLFESKIATRDQINRDIFGSIHWQTVNRRLRKLLNANLIRRKSYLFEEKCTSCYEATDKALEVIRPTYKHQISKGLIKSDSIDHDLGLVDLRAILRKSRAVRYFISESVLQSCGEFVQSSKFYPFVASNSDGAMEITMPNGVRLVAVEYEATGKSASRYKAKVIEYYESPIQAVFYVCGNKMIESILKKVEKEVYESKKLTPKFYYCQRENIQTHAKEIHFSNQRGNEVLI